MTEASCRVLETSKKESERTEAKRLIQQNFNHSFVEGQIYYEDWGTKQTNINFYQIVEKAKKE